MDERVKNIIEKSNKVVFFGGAGVSTESNIPDFRSEKGLYNAVSQFGYPPEIMLSRTFFDQHTDIFYKHYKNNLVYKDAQPNKAHLALAELEAKGKLLSVITQNIDGLHQKAGSKNVYELHGGVLRNYCMDCGECYDLDYIMAAENCGGELDGIPRCKKCSGIVKPDVVLYEEALNGYVVSAALTDMMHADCLIIGGTSLAVYPAAGYIENFRGHHIIIINKDKTPYDSRADLVIYDAIGKVLGE